MEYTHIADMFDRLNKAGCEYVVLRNYDNLLEDEIYMAGHGDIDMLCRDVKKLYQLFMLSHIDLSMERWGIMYIFTLFIKADK